MSISNPSGQRPPSVFTPEQMTTAIVHLKGMLTWVIVLLVVNLILTGYVADFVHQIITAVHQLGGNL